MSARERSILANLAAASVSRVGTAVLAFALYWWLARRLSASELGAFAYAMGLFAVLQVVPLLGRQQPMIREAARHPEQVPELVNAHWWFAWPLALLLGLGLLVHAAFAQASLNMALALTLALAMLPTSWIMVAECTLLGQERMRSIALFNFFEALWRLLGGVLVLHGGGQLLAVMLVFLTGRVMVALLYLRLPNLPLPRLRAPPALAETLQLWRSTPIYFAIIAVATLSTRFDVLALPHMVSLAQLGYYSAGAKLYEALLMLPSLAALVVLPRLARIFHEQPSRVVGLLAPLLRAVLMLGIPLALVGVAATPWCVALLFPAAFAGAAPLVQILIFAAVLATLDLLLSSLMIASNQQGEDLRTLVLGMLALAAFTLTLVPQVGPTGAAIAITVHMLVKVAYRIYWATRSLQASGLWSMLLRALVATTLALVLRSLLRQHPWAAAALSPALFVGASVLLGLLTRADLRQVRALLTARGREGPA
jgi:O-antigen/teichoic acid export membrane protein